MIRLIDIRLNAAHPELPPPEAVTYTGSPSTVFIRGVPPSYGRWAITAVFVAATFPDGSTTTRAAVQSANGVWVATLPATATSGRTENGFRIIADGIDENGEAVTGYIVCVADFAVASLAVTPAPEPGETSYQMLYFDEAPSVLRKGDVTKIDGVLKYYDGTAWLSFVTLDDTVTRTSANGVKSSGIWAAIWGALTALPTGFTSLYEWEADQLAGKLSTSGGTVTGPINMGVNYLKWQDGNLIYRLSTSGLYIWDDGDDVTHSPPYQIAFPLASGNIALTAGTGHNGNLAALDANGNPVDSDIPAANVALKADLRYALTTKSINNGAVTLDDRAINAVAVSSSLASLTVNFPAATSGKARDFGLRLTVASGITTAPQIVLPQGVTCENADGEAPEIGADGAATILYFTETAAGVFLVKGEVVTAIS